MGTILVTGGSGFIGASLAKLLLRKEPAASLVLLDVARSRRLDAVVDRVTFVEGDVSDRDTCERLVTEEVTTVYHLASLVSGAAERDFLGGYRANLDGTVNLLGSCRRLDRRPRFVFAGTTATFGGERLPDVVDDWTHQHPQTSYGVTKAIGEQLLNDYSRKGYIDGRGVRLPAIVVRDESNPAASTYVSALVREPLAGKDYTCPVASETCLPVLSIGRCVEMLRSLSELPEGSLGDYRTINGPSIAPTAQEIADAVREIGGKDAGKITFDPEPEIADIVKTWPGRVRFDRAALLGLKPDDSIEAIVEAYARERGKGG